MRWLGLNDKERQLEELCDKERYYSLKMNEEEEEMYKGMFYLKKSMYTKTVSMHNFRGRGKAKENECYSIQL